MDFNLVLFNLLLLLISLISIKLRAKVNHFWNVMTNRLMKRPLVKIITLIKKKENNKCDKEHLMNFFLCLSPPPLPPLSLSLKENLSKIYVKSDMYILKQNTKCNNCSTCVLGDCHKFFMGRASLSRLYSF